MMPDGDTAAHLRKQVGGLFLQGTAFGARVIPSLTPAPSITQAQD